MKPFEEFQEFRKILCICPECGEIVRLSDLKLKAIGSTEKTWLDKYENNCRKMDKKEEKFEEIKSKKEEPERKKGRKLAQRVFNRAISPSFRKLRLDPRDIIPLLSPIDFVVFKGMEHNEISNVMFLSRKYKNSTLNKTRQQVKTTVQKKKYDWQVARIDKQGKIELE